MTHAFQRNPALRMRRSTSGQACGFVLANKLCCTKKKARTARSAVPHEICANEFLDTSVWSERNEHETSSQHEHAAPTEKFPEAQKSAIAGFTTHHTWFSHLSQRNGRLSTEEAAKVGETDVKLRALSDACTSKHQASQ